MASSEPVYRDGYNLFRQEARGDWTKPVRDIKRALG